MFSLLLKIEAILSLLILPLFPIESSTPLLCHFSSTPQKLMALQNEYENIHLLNLEEKGLKLLHKMQEELSVFEKTCLRFSSYEEEQKNFLPYSKLKRQAGHLRSSLAVYGVFKRNRPELLQQEIFYSFFDWMLHDLISHSYLFKKGVTFFSKESIPDNDLINADLFHVFVNIQHAVPLILDKSIEKNYDKEDPDFSFSNLLKKIKEASRISLKKNSELIKNLLLTEGHVEALHKEWNHDIETINSLLKLEDSDGFHQIGYQTPLLHMRYPTPESHKIHTLYLRKYHAFMHKISREYGQIAKLQVQKTIGDEEGEKGIIYALLSPLHPINSTSYNLHRALSIQSLTNIMLMVQQIYSKKLDDLEIKKSHFTNIVDKNNFLNLIFYDDPQSMALLLVIWPWYSVIFSKAL